MADVIPFRGILYNPEKIDDHSLVVTPPYDVISEKEQCEYHECHPNNPIRLVLGLQNENDTETDNCHTRAGDCFCRWLSDDVMIQDGEPAFYLTSIEFPLEDRTIIRYGVIGLVGLEPFEKKIVLPHERTFSNVKSERLKLMKACHANFCPIFALYSDTENLLEILVGQAKANPPVSDFTDRDGHRQKLWRITEKSVIDRVTETMREKRIFIADGHHRYETALAYREWVSENTPDFTSDHPANHVMMYLSSMEDPGLVILPAHRLLKGITATQMDEFEGKASPYFEIQKFPFDGAGFEDARNAFLETLKSNSDTNAFGVVMKDRPEFLLLVKKPNVMEEIFGGTIPAAMINIDVTVLTRLIFMKVLGFDEARLDNEKLIGYSSVAEKGIDAVRINGYDMAFIINPTKIGQVRRVANEGLIMPRKSTYFYPKVITGQVMNNLSVEN